MRLMIMEKIRIVTHCDFKVISLVLLFSVPVEGKVKTTIKGVHEQFLCGTSTDQQPIRWTRVNVKEMRMKKELCL